MNATSPGALMGLAVAAIAVLVLLVTWRKMNAFLALFIAALLVGLGAGMAPLAVLKTFQEGLGATMGGIAAVIALGFFVMWSLPKADEPLATIAPRWVQALSSAWAPPCRSRIKSTGMPATSSVL